MLSDDLDYQLELLQLCVEQDLEMPPGYTADAQINRYAFEQTGRPRLIRLGAWVGGVLIAILGLLWWRRGRRRT